MNEYPTKKRLVYAKAEHVRLESGIHAMIGPFEGNPAEEELRDAIQAAVARYNTKHGYMTFGKAPV